MAEYVCQPKSFLQIIFYFACYHTDASLLYQCVIEGKLLLGSAGTTLSQLWKETPLIHRILAQVDVFCSYMRYSLIRYDKVRPNWAFFIARVLCFYYVAEGSNFLKRGSTHPPSFPMFHSPRVENGVRLKQMSSNFSRKISSLYAFTSRLSVNIESSWSLFLALDAFTANYSDTLTEQRSTALFQVLSWTWSWRMDARQPAVNNLPNVTVYNYIFWGYIHVFLPKRGSVFCWKRMMPMAHLLWSDFTSREDKMNQRLSFLLSI